MNSKLETTSPLPWLLARLKPNCASIAERNLARQGFTTFLPLERRIRRQNGQLKSVKAPYFPGYIFVRDDAHTSPWRAIHSTHGISQLVSFGLRPATVPTKVMEELLAYSDNEGCIQGFSQVAEGDEVQVSSGPLATLIGRIDKLAPEERAWLLIDIMGKATRTLVRRDDIRRTGK